MATLRTGQTTNFSGQNTEFSIAPKSLDTNIAGETRYTPEFDKWNGIYRLVPEFRTVLDKFASWTFGKGIKADPKNEEKLKKIKGNGKESPRVVLKKQWREAMLCGDSFAHIIKDNQGRMTNLKPLNPQRVTIVSNSEGIIIKYEQLGANEKNEQVVINTFDIDEIFHLSYERIGDENHGIPFGEAMEDLINSRNEGVLDLRIMYHRNVKPISFFEVETEDTTKLNALESTINTAYKKSENVIIPVGVLKEIKQAKVGEYATLNSLDYIKFLVREFVTSSGMPEIIMGWGENTTEASAKIMYLAFQQDIEDKQLYNEEQIELQLGIVVELEFPADLMESAAAGVSTPGAAQSQDITSPASLTKDGNKGAAQPKDVKI